MTREHVDKLQQFSPGSLLGGRSFFCPEHTISMVPETTEKPPTVNGSIDLASVRAIAEPVVHAHGLLLCDIVWTSSPAGPVLRVTIEHDVPVEGPPGIPRVSGVTLDDCVSVSRDLSLALDTDEVIPQHYNLEVSSPGLDRPLRTAEDFRRQIGRLAKLKLTEPASDGQVVLRGMLTDMEGDRVAIIVDGKRHEVSLDNIHQARLVFELGAQQKKGAKRPTKGASSRPRKRTG